MKQPKTYYCLVSVEKKPEKSGRYGIVIFDDVDTIDSAYYHKEYDEWKEVGPAVTHWLKPNGDGYFHTEEELEELKKEVAGDAFDLWYKWFRIGDGTKEQFINSLFNKEGK